jgi:hypothetical protein
MKTDGNVVYPDAWKPPAPVLPQMSVTCEVLYADQHAQLIRVTYRLGGRTMIHHIASGVGLDA